MLKSVKEIKRITVDKRQYIEDNIIDKRFIMEHLECKNTKALKVISEANRYGKETFNRTPVKLGTTVLSWYWKINGLNGEFV